MHPKLSASGRSLIRPRRWESTDALSHCCYTVALRVYWCTVDLMHWALRAKVHRPQLSHRPLVSIILLSSSSFCQHPHLLVIILRVIILCVIILFVIVLCVMISILFEDMCVLKRTARATYTVATVYDTKNIGLECWILKEVGVQQQNCWI